MHLFALELLCCPSARFWWSARVVLHWIAGRFWTTLVKQRWFCAFFLCCQIKYSSAPGAEQSAAKVHPKEHAMCVLQSLDILRKVVAMSGWEPRAGCWWNSWGNLRLPIPAGFLGQRKEKRQEGRSYLQRPYVHNPINVHTSLMMELSCLCVSRVGWSCWQIAILL